VALAPGPIPLDQLSEAVQKVAGPAAPAPLKLMAARGLAPMGPADLVTAIFQLAKDSDEKVAQAADKTAATLPDKIVGGALPGSLDARVLDFFARKVLLKPSLLELVILNHATDDETFVYLAGNCAERELELIAANESRILRHPKIIEALYWNKQARMSTVDRLIELAVRHGIRCEGIPQFDDVAKALEAQGPPVFDGTSFEIDSQFQAAAKAGDELDQLVRAKAETAGEEGAVDEMDRLISDERQPELKQEEQTKKQRIQDLPMSAKLRLATIGNATARLVLVKDPNKVVAMAAINSPALSDLEAVAIAQNRQVSRDVLSALARNRSFLKLYQVKIGLAFNPKAPLDVVVKLVSYLHEHDVKKLAKSKNVPSQVTSVARRLVEQREKKSK
jgi:hypothetical protein